MTRAVWGFEWALRRRDAARDAMPAKRQFMIGVLVVLLLSSAFSVIYLKELSRKLFIQYQQLQQTQQQAETEWSKLLLEEGAWSTQQRVQSVAAAKLDMAVPVVKKIIVQ